MKTKCAIYDISVTTVDFGMKDEKGRSVGYLIRVWKKEFKEHLEGESTHPPGEFWVADTSATRNGQLFGSQKSIPEADTLQEVEDMVQKRMNVAKAIYQKKYGPR